MQEVGVLLFTLSSIHDGYFEIGKCQVLASPSRPHIDDPDVEAFSAFYQLVWKDDEGQCGCGLSRGEADTAAWRCVCCAVLCVEEQEVLT